MTMVRQMPVQCPKCGQQGQAEIYATLNVSLDPSLKERLLSGELLRWQCQACGVQLRNEYPILYHDMAQALLIQWMSPPYAPTLEQLAAALPSEVECQHFKQLRSDYRFRVVREYDDLLEKIRIFDAGLDERAIEWEKCLYSEKTKDKVDSREAGSELQWVEPRFQRAFESHGQRHLEFSGPVLLCRPGYPPLPFMLKGPDTVYQKALRYLDEHLPWPKPIQGDFLLVDQNYIKSLWSPLPNLQEGSS